MVIAVSGIALHAFCQLSFKRKYLIYWAHLIPEGYLNLYLHNTSKH